MPACKLGLSSYVYSLYQLKLDCPIAGSCFNDVVLVPAQELDHKRPHVIVVFDQKNAADATAVRLG